jgi:hypothetical protein
MMHDAWILALLIVCAIPANGYAILYARRNWWATEPGRALMVKSLANMGLIDLGLATEIFGRDFPGRSIIRMGVFLLFAAGMWFLFIALLRTEKYPRIPWCVALRRRFGKR